MRPPPGGRTVPCFLVTETLLVSPGTLFAFVAPGVRHEVWETLGGHVATLLHFKAQASHPVCPCWVTSP